MNKIQKLQEWYLSMCNGDWEHAYGVRIETLDNPGWSVDVDLKDTDVANVSFSTVEYGVGANADHGGNDWLWCKVEDGIFKGRGGPGKLEEMIKIFLDWYEKNSEPDAAVDQTRGGRGPGH